MGYLIGGAGESPEQKLSAREGQYSHLSDADLLDLHAQTVKDVTKFSNFQMVRKITLNSLYGALGNQYFRHYKLENAEAITLTGQVAIRWIERKLNEYVNSLLKTDGQDYVIASDTDSIYLDLSGLVGSSSALSSAPHERVVDVLNKFCQDKIEPYISESYDRHRGRTDRLHRGETT
jgi:hypothetical protein